MGAAGASAGTVIPALAKRGAYVRGLIHEPKQTVARNQGAAEIAVADSRERGSMDAAMEASLIVLPGSATNVSMSTSKRLPIP